MITFMDSKDKSKDTKNCLDSQLWHACAGGMVQMPQVNSRVYYFVQGHIEHTNGFIDFGSFPRISPYVLCRVEDIKFLADQEIDEVYARIRLFPISSDVNFSDENIGVNGSEIQENKPNSFAKTLTQSDANNGGGFSVPRYCAETIFPRLDYSADPPVQNIIAKDVHGESWKFRHIYRGTPRRHLLTTGWSSFVNAKKLIAGDSIVFLRAENGDLRVGIRRAKRGLEGRDSNFGLSGFFRDNENRTSRSGNGFGLNSGMNTLGKEKVKVESVFEAVTRVSKGKPFEVVYYPRAGSPEFVVKAGNVKEALEIRWCSGMRFKMPFETEDASRISWFMGSISSVKVVDPLHWPDSPWRLLQVTWDEPDLLQNVKRVSPWLVELVSNIPPINLYPFSQPRKKLRLPFHPDFLMDTQFPFPTYPGNFYGSKNPFGCLPDNSPAGMQGARHAHFDLSMSDIHLNNLPSGFIPALPKQSSSFLGFEETRNDENLSCLLSMGNSNYSIEKPNVRKPRHFVLFGKPILIEEQTSESSSSETLLPLSKGNSSSEVNMDKVGNDPNCSILERNPWMKNDRLELDLELEIGQCKVFMESEDVGRTLELTLLSSYDELLKRLADMFGIDCCDMLNRVVYRDNTGSPKQIGGDPFSDFARRTKRLTILMDSSNYNIGD